MIISTIIIFVISFFGLITTFYLMYRNSKVYELRTRILNLCSEHDHDNFDEIINGEKNFMFNEVYMKLPSYDKMMISFTPLKIQNYVEHEKLIELLKSNK